MAVKPGPVRQESSNSAISLKSRSVILHRRARGFAPLTELLGGPMIEGDQVAIRWRFTFAFRDGGKLQQEEVAWQTWRGEKIATETFFYDPAQRD
jgi:ketosteroid isomerase-like protein